MPLILSEKDLAGISMPSTKGTPKKRPQKVLEATVQAYCLERLSLLEKQGKCYFFRSNSFQGMIIRNDQSKGFIRNAKPGLPDITLCVGGRFVAIECKSSKGQQTPEQMKTESAIAHAGGLYFVVRSPEDMEAVLKQLGF